MNTSESKIWESIIEKTSQKFNDGIPLDLDGLLFLIGVREYGGSKIRFKKDEKIDLMHIAICRCLKPYGYYHLEGIDNDGWPHYKNIEPLPPLKAGEQTVLMKRAIIKYFEEEGLL